MQDGPHLFLTNRFLGLLSCKSIECFVMQRAYYSNTIENFLADEPDVVLGQLVRQSEFAVEQPQRDAWLAQIRQLKPILTAEKGSIYFEYAIPRMGKRVDVLLVIGTAIFVLEYKVGEESILAVQHRPGRGLCTRPEELSRIEPRSIHRSRVHRDECAERPDFNCADTAR